MASGAARSRMDVERFLELFAEIDGGFYGLVGGVFLHVGVVVVEIVNFFERAKMHLGGAVAIKAPCHGVRLDLFDDFHFVHLAVAALA